MATKRSTSRRNTLAIADIAKRAAQAFLAGREGIQAAEAAVAQARTGQLHAFIDAFEGSPEITVEKFNAEFREPFTAAMVASGKYKPESVRPMLTQIMVCAVAITHGHKPQDGETTLNLFYQGVKDRLAKEGLYQPKMRRPRPGGNEKSTTKPGAAASSATTITAEQAFKVAFAKLNVATDDAKIERLVKIIKQKPGEFWRKLDAILTV